MTGRIAWFAPYSDLWITSRMEHRAANALVDAGYDVTVIHCDTVLDSYCAPMVAARLSATSPERDKREVCARCTGSAGILARFARYRVLQLSSFVQEDDERWADEICGEVTPESWESIVEDGQRIGRIATYTTMLHHKQGSVAQSRESWAEYRADLRNALLMSRAVPRMFDQLNPGFAFVYNALYPPNRVFADGMRSRGATLVNLAGGPSVPRRYATLALYNSLIASQTTVDSQSLQRSMQVPCTTDEVEVVESHLHSLMEGSDPWVYSSAPSRKAPAEIRSELGLRTDSPVVTVIVSSLDETRATTLVDAEYRSDLSKGFSEPEEFLRQCSALAAAHPEIDFVFRLHPRLAPNKRERVTSPDLAVINEILEGLPPNATVNHPADGISLYDLISISAAGINHTSSAGLEFLGLAVPVIQYDPLRSGIYPVELSFCVQRNDPDAFSRALDEAFAAGTVLDRTVLAVRWLAGLQVRAMVHLDPIAPASSSSQQVQASSSELRRFIGRLIPQSVKAAMSRRAELASREQDCASLDLGDQAQQELVDQLAAVRPDTDVWEPALRLPTTRNQDEELEAVRAMTNRLRTRILLPTIP